MNGNTVVSSFGPLALPLDATAAPRRRVRSTYGSVADPDRVDCARPPLGLEWLALDRHLVATQDPDRAERAQSIGLIGLAGRRPDLVPTLREDRHGDASDATAGTSDQHRAIAGSKAVLLERDDGHPGGEPGRPDGHRFAGR